MRPPLFLALAMAIPSLLSAQSSIEQLSPHRQLPKAMHGQMIARARVTVGVRDADITGVDHRALQAAVDYVASLGGGTVEIGAGEFLMRDSLHLRPHVTVRGQGAKTVLRKTRAASSPLEIDGDYGEEQITLKNPDAFAVGDGVAIWDKNAGIRVRGETRDLVFKGNTIRDTRPASDRKQTTGITLEENVGDVQTDGNTIDAGTAILDNRKKR